MGLLNDLVAQRVGYNITVRGLDIVALQDTNAERRSGILFKCNWSG